MVGHTILTYIYLSNKNMYTCIVMVGLSDSIEIIIRLVAVDQDWSKTKKKDGPSFWLMFLYGRSCLIWVMINCSKFICSKKLVDTIFHLLDTIRANVTFLSTGWKSKIICRTCISSSFNFRQKNINCSNCNWSTKVLENVNWLG